MKGKYKIYHIQGVKVGVTTNISRRAKQLGYDPRDLIILFSTSDITLAGNLERKLQKRYKYSVDQINYGRQMEIKNKLNTMKIYVSELTVSFPFNKSEASDLRRELIEQGIVLSIGSKSILITETLADWIIENLKVSKFEKMSFVYIKSLLKFVKKVEESGQIKKENKEWQPFPGSNRTVKDAAIAPQDEVKLWIASFEKVRVWAQERGIYDKGDVKTQLIKLYEEAGETSKAILNKDNKEIKDGIGDMVVVLINLAHLAGTSLEECLEAAWSEIKNRKGEMVNGTFVKQTVKSI
jgi:NTP pyrophosphatase (non-canonical NTP hydrolase)